MLPRYFKTKFQKNSELILACILKILLLILPQRKMSTKDNSWRKKRPVLRASNLTTVMCRLCWNLEASPSCSPQVLSRPVMRFLYLYCQFWMLTCLYHMYCSSSQHTAIHYPWRADEYNRSDYQRCTSGWNPGLRWSKEKHVAGCVGRIRTSNRFQQHHNRVANLGFTRSHWNTKISSTVLIVKIVYFCL